MLFFGHEISPFVWWPALNYIQILSSYRAVNTLSLGYRIANGVLLGAVQRFTKAFFNLNMSCGVPAHTTCSCIYACMHHFDETHKHSAASNLRANLLYRMSDSRRATFGRTSLFVRVSKVWLLYRRFSRCWESLTRFLQAFPVSNFTQIGAKLCKIVAQCCWCAAVKPSCQCADCLSWNWPT